MVFLRFDTQNTYNIEVLDILINGVKSKTDNDMICGNVLRIMPKWTSQLLFQEKDEEFEVQEEVLKLVTAGLEHMKFYLDEGKYEISCDLADLLHALPEFVLSSPNAKLKKYEKIYIKPFEKKWNTEVFENKHDLKIRQWF